MSATSVYDRDQWVDAVSTIRAEPERAEYVRGEVRRRGLSGEDHARWVELRDRGKQLFEASADAGGWAAAPAEILGNKGHTGWDRGFAEAVYDVTAAFWLAHGDSLYRREPVRRVRLTTRPNIAAMREGEGGWVYGWAAG